MQTTARLIMGFVGFVVVVAACGGSSGSDVNAPAADAGGSSSGASSGTSGLGSSSGASSGGASSGAISDGGSSSSGDIDGGSNTDAGSKVGNTTTQTCGGAPCSIADNVCCVTGSTGAKCVPKATGCGTGAGGGDSATLRCSGQANCGPNTVCCIHDAATGATSECKPKCAVNEAQLCDPTADVSGCAAGVKCSSDNIGDWNLPKTFATCGGVGN